MISLVWIIARCSVEAFKRPMYLIDKRGTVAWKCSGCGAEHWAMAVLS